jgi:hypothetical protein
MPYDASSLNAPFEALKGFDWGGDAAAFKPIDEAVIASHGDPAARTDLEGRLAALLGKDVSTACKEYVCRKLALIGGVASVPSLAALLGDAKLSHMARFALEKMTVPDAAAALRTALGQVDDDLKIGMISSLAARADAASVSLLAPLVAAGGPVAVAAARALGRIQTPQAIEALAGVDAFSGDLLAAAVVDARLGHAERLLAKGDRAAALAMYKSLAVGAAGKPQSTSIERAARRGILACLDTSAAV